MISRIALLSATIFASAPPALRSEPYSCPLLFDAAHGHRSTASRRHFAFAFVVLSIVLVLHASALTLTALPLSLSSHTAAFYGVSALRHREQPAGSPWLAAAFAPISARGGRTRVLCHRSCILRAHAAGRSWTTPSWMTCKSLTSPKSASARSKPARS